MHEEQFYINKLYLLSSVNNGLSYVYIFDFYGVWECCKILRLKLLCMLAFGSATGHCSCSYLYVGHWKCYLVTISVTTLYAEPIVTYYSCKILILSILLVIKDWGCNTETVISIYLFIFLGKYYALSCLIVLKECSKENCDKKPIKGRVRLTYLKFFFFFFFFFLFLARLMIRKHI